MKKKLLILSLFLLLPFTVKAYTYSGTFRSTGKRITGEATVSSDGSTLTFTEDAVSL